MGSAQCFPRWDDAYWDLCSCFCHLPKFSKLQPQIYLQSFVIWICHMKKWNFLRRDSRLELIVQPGGRNKVDFHNRYYILIKKFEQIIPLLKISNMCVDWNNLFSRIQQKRPNLIIHKHRPESNLYIQLSPKLFLKIWGLARISILEAHIQKSRISMYLPIPTCRLNWPDRQQKYWLWS